MGDASPSLSDLHGLASLIVASSFDGVAVLDPELRVVVWNPALERMANRDAEHAVGRQFVEVFPQADEVGALERLRRALGGEDVLEESVPCRDPETGREWCYDVRHAPIVHEHEAVVGVLTIVRSTTERRRLEEELRRSRKSEAAGQLAAGVAHDFNNLLTAIRGFNELLGLHLAGDELASRYVSGVSKAAEQACGLVHQLRAFASREAAQRQEVELVALVRTVEPLLARLGGDEIRTTVAPSSDEAWTLADPTEIEQVLVNLVLNARDALPDGGRVDIAVRAEGETVCLVLGDSGVGMDAETASRAFDPFFTTKPVGAGTGLGLATVYGIVERNGGHVELDTSPGEGTTVRILLPRTDTPDAAAHARELSSGGRVRPPTILLVEVPRASRRSPARCSRARATG